MPSETKRLVDAYRDAIRDTWQCHTSDSFEASKALDAARRALDAHLAKMQAVVDAADEVNASCDYIVFSGHKEDEHDLDCAKCRMDTALRALAAHDGNGDSNLETFSDPETGELLIRRSDDTKRGGDKHDGTGEES